MVRSPQLDCIDSVPQNHADYVYVARAEERWAAPVYQADSRHTSPQRLKRLLLNTHTRRTRIPHMSLVPPSQLIHTHLLFRPTPTIPPSHQLNQTKPTRPVAKRGCPRPRIPTCSTTPDGHFMPQTPADVEQEIVEYGNDPRGEVDDGQDEADADDPALDELELRRQDRVPRHD